MGRCAAPPWVPAGFPESLMRYLRVGGPVRPSHPLFRQSARMGVLPEVTTRKDPRAHSGGGRSQVLAGWCSVCVPSLAQVTAAGLGRPPWCDVPPLWHVLVIRSEPWARRGRDADASVAGGTAATSEAACRDSLQLRS